MTDWIRVTTPFAVGSVEIKKDRVTKATPRLGLLMGKTVSDVYRIARRRGWSLEEFPPDESF